jgi:hypothetical protein
MTNDIFAAMAVAYSAIVWLFDPSPTGTANIRLFVPEWIGVDEDYCLRQEDGYINRDTPWNMARAVRELLDETCLNQDNGEDSMRGSPPSREWEETIKEFMQDVLSNPTLNHILNKMSKTREYLYAMSVPEIYIYDEWMKGLRDEYGDKYRIPVVLRDLLETSAIGHSPRHAGRGESSAKTSSGSMTNLMDID